MSVLNNTLKFKDNIDYFIAPGLQILTKLLEEQLREFGLANELITEKNIIQWISKQSFLDFGSNKGRFLSVSLENMGNDKVDAIYFNESTIHYPKNFQSGLKTWSEISPNSKRIAVGALVGNSKTKLPDDLAQMNIENYSALILNLSEILTDNGIAVIDHKTIDEPKLLASLRETNSHFIKRHGVFIISKKDLYSTCQEIVREVIPLSQTWQDFSVDQHPYLNLQQYSRQGIARERWL